MTPEFSGENPGPIPTHQSRPVSATLLPPGRNLSPDIIRGVAVMGALFVSIWAFGGFSSNQQNGLLLQSKGWNYRLLGAIELIFNGKMRALISIVFGAGMVIFLSRKYVEGRSAEPDVFIRRQMWLMAFGLVNALIFLWPNDILFHLGIMGILLFPFVRLAPRTLLIVSVITTLIFSAKNYWNYADDRSAYTKYTAVVAFEKKLSKDSLLAAQKKLPSNQKKDSLSKQQKEDKSTWEGILNSRKHDPKKNDEGVKEIRNGSFGKIWDHILPMTQSREAQWTYRTGIWDLAGMILLGMALFKFGFFEPGFSGKRQFLLAVSCLVLGCLLGWFRLQYLQYSLHDYTNYIIKHPVPSDVFFPFERALLATGYASLLLLLVKIRALKFMWWGFARVGQMALSNYLLQSILCSLFFTGFGMGYFGRLLQYQLYLFVLEISIVQIIFSVIWLRYYHYGPAEWLLRCLMNKKWLPNKQQSSEDPASVITALS